MKTIACLLLLPFLFISCKKDKDPASCRLASVDVYVDGKLDVIRTYTYNASGQVSSTRSKYVASGNPDDVTTFNYSSGQVTISLNGKLVRTHHLDASGRIVSATFHFDSPNPNQLSLVYEYTYDAQDYLTHERSIFSQDYNGTTLRDTSTVDYTIMNGNYVKTVSTQSGSAPQTLTFQYSSSVDKLRHSNDQLSGANSVGKPSQNLLSAMLDETGQLLVRYDYSFFGSGLVAEKTETHTDPAAARIRTVYHYDCD